VGIPVRRAGVIAAGLSVAAAAAVSLPSSRVAWTLETVQLVRSGDPARGKELNKDCVDCHGTAGVVDTPDVPNLAGQDPLYTFKQLKDYKDELRASPIMGEVAKTMSDRDMADLAAFFAAQPAAPFPPSPPAPDPGILRLAASGDGTRLIPACEVCHGQGGAGDPGSYGMPNLRSQKFDDLSYQLTTFRSGERTNDVYSVMRDVSRKLSDTEIAGLAAYYSGTLPKKPEAAPAAAPEATPVPAPSAKAAGN
jgi:cytochrome c553